MTRSTSIVLLVALSLTMACGGGAEAPVAPDVDEAVPEWVRIEESGFDDIRKAQLTAAVTAQQEMASSLMAELKGELEAGGPGGAVTVCRDMAPMIAEYIADEHGVRIGRTSHRLRNASNTPPEWALEVVEGAAGGQAFFAGPTGELGVLSPITVAAPCLACHGPADGLSEEVTASLADSYPDDEAVGFAEGDLRGWFWVEVPPSAG